MKSIIYSNTREELKSIIDNSTSIKEAIETIGLRDVGNNRGTFLKVVDKLDLKGELNSLKERARKYQNKFLKQEETLFEDVFCECSIYPRKKARARIIKDNLLEYRCEICGNDGEWLGKSLSLHLDHINGIANDHRLENLRFLCPNCHNQTSTYAGKRKYNAPDLYKKRMEKKRKREIFIEQRKKDLEEVDIRKYGWVGEISKKWDISHTQVKRWVRKNLPDLEFYERKKHS